MLAVTLGTLFSWIGTIVVLGGGIGTAYAILTANAAKTKTETWKDEWAAQKERADRFQQAWNECQLEVASIRAEHLVEIAKVEARNKLLEGRIEYLEGVIHRAINASPKVPTRKKSAPRRVR